MVKRITTGIAAPSKHAHEDRSFEKNHALSQFFRTTYSDLLLNPCVRVLIITAFLAYLVS